LKVLHQNRFQELRGRNLPQVRRMRRTPAQDVLAGPLAKQDCPATRWQRRLGDPAVRKLSWSHASYSPAASEYMGEQHCGERRDRKARQVRELRS
jgi:hypothetical protein